MGQASPRTSNVADTIGSVVEKLTVAIVESGLQDE